MKFDLAPTYFYYETENQGIRSSSYNKGCGVFYDFLLFY